MNKPTVGQQLFSLNVGNAARHRAQALTPVVVTKVGRKYFYASRDGLEYTETSFRLDDWSQNTGGYIASQCLYETEREWEDEKEAYCLCAVINKAFEYGKNRNNLPLSSLREIAAIISREDDEGSKDDE